MGYTSINVTIIVDYVGKIHSVEEKKSSFLSTFGSVVISDLS